jgi:hypothetical protein
MEPAEEGPMRTAFVFARELWMTRREAVIGVGVAVALFVLYAALPTGELQYLFSGVR